MSLGGTKPELNRECSVLVCIHFTLLVATEVSAWLSAAYNVMNIYPLTVFYFNSLSEQKDILE